MKRVLLGLFVLVACRSPGDAWNPSTARFDTDETAEIRIDPPLPPATPYPGLILVRDVRDRILPGILEDQVAASLRQADVGLAVEGWRHLGDIVADGFDEGNDDQWTSLARRYGPVWVLQLGTTDRGHPTETTRTVRVRWLRLGPAREPAAVEFFGVTEDLSPQLNLLLNLLERWREDGLQLQRGKNEISIREPGGG